MTGLSAEEQKEKMREIASEVRRYSGSPDFWRKGVISTGQTIENLNLIFMFLNARIQGTAADLARLTGSSGGSKQAITAWTRLLAAVGVPTLTLMLHNLDDEERELEGPEGKWTTTNRESYNAVPAWERETNFMIPRSTYFINDRGERVREYYKIPKREIIKLFANMIEAGVLFADEQDARHLKSFAASFLENISPVNVSGETAMERAESVVGSMNPIIKTPGEMIFNRDTFRHRQIVPDYIDGVKSRDLPAGEQYTRSTPKSFVRVGQMLHVSPLLLEHATRGFSAGLITQFMPPRQQPGRAPVLSLPAIGPVARRFVRSESTAKQSDNEILDAALKDAAVERVTRNRSAHELYQTWKKSPAGKDLKVFLEEHNATPAIATEAFDLKEEDDLNLTRDDKQIKMLGVENGDRARFLKTQLEGKSDEEKQKLIQEWRTKKLASKEVLRQLQLSDEQLRQWLERKAQREFMREAARQKSSVDPAPSGIRPRTAAAP
jgi:hypothetical protein